MKAFIASLLIALAAVAAVGQTMPKYGVTAQADKQTNFSALKTYAWETGWHAYDPAIHDRVVAAVERELSALGFTKTEPDAADVAVSYASLRRDDVDLKSKARTADGLRPRYPVATLVILMRHPETRKELFRARVDTPLDTDREKAAATIDDGITRMFARYPTRHDTHR